MIQKMLIALPELHERYEQEKTFWGDTEEVPLHIAAGDIIVPAIETAARNMNQDFLRRAFLFIEELLTSGNEELENVAAVSILEDIEDSALSIADSMIGSESRAYLSELYAFYRSGSYSNENDDS